MSQQAELRSGSTLFEIAPNVAPDAPAPYLQLVEYEVQRTTPTLVIVRVVRRDGRTVKYKLEAKWSLTRVGSSVFVTALEALGAYALRQDRESFDRKAGALRCEAKRDWARAQIKAAK